jgi:hypothetical protein
LILLAEGDCTPLGAFVASLQSCGSIHLGNGIRRLDREGTKAARRAMDDRDRLAFYPLCGRQDRLQGLLAQWGLPIGAAGS